MGANDLRVNVVSDAEGMVKLAPEWTSLADSCRTATIFQTPEWNIAWWRRFGRVPGKCLRILEMRDADGRLVGLAPLMTSFWFATPLRRISFIGTGTNDYNDVIAAPGQEAAVAKSFHGYLSKSHGWNIADLQQLRDGGCLRSAAPGNDDRLRHVDIPQEACPYVTLPPEWPDYLARLGKKTRYNVGYYERTLRKVYEVEIGPVTDGAQLDDEMERLFELHQRRWNERWLPGVFGGARVQRFHKEAARALLERGRLRLFTLKLDGQTEAALYCFAFNDRMCYYQGGFEPTLARFSPGTVLTAHAVRQAIEERFPVFDFLRGEEEYKAKWTTESFVNARRLMTHGGTPLMLLARTVQRVEQSVEHRAKDWIKRKIAGDAAKAREAREP
jgi:CelD/BcsL family acetyltransferase involved in cellulose biosynthesis